MNLRIQTYDNIEAQKVLEKGLDDLMTLCDIMLEKFEQAAAEFEENGMDVSR
jgi:DNA-directed RNA polymerases I and III subunit RPAC2